MSDHLCELIANLIRPNRAERWTAKQVMAHGFYTAETRDAMDDVKEEVAEISGSPLDLESP